MRRINVLGGFHLTREDSPVVGAATQPRRMAVLALLTVAGERGVNRWQICTWLWPDTDEERGRHALTQSLYALRRDLDAEELFLGQQDLRLNPDLITSDYAEFHAAIRCQEPERAVEIYRGPFLQGFHLARADIFDRWVEEQRTALEQEFGRVLEWAARRATERRDYPAAVRYLKQLAAQDPLSPKVAVRLMEALAAQGDTVAALQHARAYESTAKQEFDLPPDAEVVALAQRLRTVARSAREPSTDPGRTEKAGGKPTSEPVASLNQAAGPVSTPRKRRWVIPVAVALAGLFIVSLASLALGIPGHARRNPARGERPVVAVGVIADYTGNRPGVLGRPLADMLATNLARGTGFRVISNARMLELVGQLRGTTDSSGLVNVAAREAGAVELIDGSLYAIARNRYRLDLRRMDLVHGSLIRVYRVEGPDLFALVDSGTTGLVPDLGYASPPTPLAMASTSSVEAYQAYEDGLHRFYEGDFPSAEAQFRRALALDSLFAQAAYYYSLSTTSGSQSEMLDRLRRAVQLSGRASDRERLLIRARWEGNNSSPALAAIADTLMVRYPEEVDGYFLAAEAANLAGDFARAVPLLRRVLVLDSLGFRRPDNGRCRVCESYMTLGFSYSAMDSQPEMHAVMREWVRRQPRSVRAWRAVAAVYATEHQADSAMVALWIADSLDPSKASTPRDRNLLSVLTILQRYPELEDVLRAELKTAPPSDRARARWDLAVTCRKLGRLREALVLAQEYRMGIRERLLPGAAPYNALLEGQVLFELGRYRAAAALFDSIAVGKAGEIEPSGRARERVWAWVHEADALAQLGDTARLRVLADTMEVLGKTEAHARDRVLHAHVRGLLARVRGRDEEAVQWFRRAIVSPVLGFTRSNYELGALYLLTGRTREAVKILRQATYAGTDGSGLYVTQTDLEARLAQAFDAAGQADSALLYYRQVLRAWVRADPQFLPRRDSLMLAVARLERL